MSAQAWHRPGLLQLFIHELPFLFQRVGNVPYREAFFVCILLCLSFPTVSFLSQPPINNGEMALLYSKIFQLSGMPLSRIKLTDPTSM